MDQWNREGKRKGYGGVKMMEICHITYGHNIMKPTKHCWKEGIRGGGGR
jgi:hypothetical protein